MPEQNRPVGIKEAIAPASPKRSSHNGAAGPAQTAYRKPVVKETVFDEKTFRPKGPDTTTSRAAMTKSSRKYAFKFLIAGAISGMEFYSSGKNGSVENTISLITCILFFLLSIYAYKLSRGAFLTAIVIYSFSTLLMVGAILWTAFHSDLGMPYVLTYWKRLGARGILIYNLRQQYCQLTDLYHLENL